jgi:uncharacterized protein (TIGR00730 family)
MQSHEGDKSRPTSHTSDEALLSTPPEPAFLHTDVWRLFRIQAEFTDGFQALAGLGHAVTIFGSARTHPDDPMYTAATDLAAKLGRQGFSIVTGGGPGIMEAANKGAHEVGAVSVGLNIELPFEQRLNPYVNLPLTFRYFFVRKTMFVKYAEAFVIFPGGFGTLDEMFEALTLIQTGKLKHFPVILFGSAYWNELLAWMRGTLLARANIASEDIDIMMVTDSIDDAVACITNAQSAKGDMTDSGPIHPREHAQ